MSSMQDLHFQSVTTRDQFTGKRTKNNQGDSSNKPIVINNCYVEEQSRVLDNFILDSHKLLSSLMQRLNHFMQFTRL